MKNVKSEKGAITILVLVSVLFMVSFLISAYVIIANKVQTQKEIISNTKSIYENYDMKNVYNGYFGKDIIPISNKEQLLLIGTCTDKIIEGNYYNFANNENTIYLLANDIEFNAYEEESLIDENGDYYWIPIGERTDFLAGFEGNGHEIRVKYKDQDNDEYTVVYSEKESYTEPEYKVKIIPKILSEDGTVANDATIWTSSGENSEFVAQDVKGEQNINVKRRIATKVYATCEGYKNSGTATIYIENPDKIQDYNLVLGKYTFTINANPSNAKVTINGIETNTISVNKGETVSWKVEANNYTTQEGSQVISDDTTINISLNKIRYTLEIQPSPANSTVTISSNGTTLKSGIGTQSVEVDIGTTLTYTVSKIYYYSNTSTVTMNSNSSLNITLSAKPEQTIRLTPTSVSGSGFTNLGNANNTEDNTGNNAYTTLNNQLYWNFDASSINSNAKINSMVIKYRLGTTVANTKATVRLRANGTEYFSTVTDGMNLLMEGYQYENIITNIPSVSEIKSSLTLSAQSRVMRCYGASITIKYVDP